MIWVFGVACLLLVLLAGWIYLRNRQSEQALETLRQALRALAENDLERLPELRSGGHGLVREAFWQLWDVRERLQQMNQQVQELATRWKTVTTHMDEGLVLLDPFLRVLSINPQATEALGVTERQALGRPLLEVSRALDLEAAMRRALDDGQPVTLEYTQSFPAERILEVHITPILRASPAMPADEPLTVARRGRRELLVVIRNITRFRRLERMRADFVAAVSHELSTPLTSIRGFAETLLEGALKDEAHARRFVTIIHEESVRLGRLVDDLLELSRLESGHWQSHRQEVDLAEVAAAILTRLHDARRKKELSITLDFPAGLPPAWADRDQVSQVLLNLVDNSIKYTPPGGSIHLAARYNPDGHDLYVVVRDTGVGIPPEHLGRVFERFYRVDKARSRASGGTGLGLSIVKHIVEGHGGRVWAESRGPGTGTAVTFTLPAAVPGETREEGPGLSDVEAR